MDFYIRTFDLEMIGSGSSASYPIGRELQFRRQTAGIGYGYFDIISFDTSPDPLARFWTLGSSTSLGYSSPPVQTYHAVDSSDYISEYLKEGLTYPKELYASKTTVVSGFCRNNWTDKGWTPGTQATFEEELCDFFYSITQQQPANVGTLGAIPDTVSLYLYRVLFTDTSKYTDIPVFTRGNDPAYDRIYTAGLVV